MPKISKTQAEELVRLRHSAAHVLAQAVQTLYPGTKLAIGPAIETGFYYDLDRDEPFTEDDLARIESKMKEIVEAGQEFSREEVSKKEAAEFFKKRGEIYKIQILEDIPEPTVSLYRNGPFVDLCRGNHIKNTREIKALKLLSVAGAYWRGDERNKMLQRIYGTAFFSKEDLESHLKQIEEAKKRDHRKLGKELDLFSFHPEAPGVPFYHPKGQRLYETLVDYWRKEHLREGYQEIRTPMLLREDLWKQSGHYEHYRDNMFFSKTEEGMMAVKPMNCPGSTLVYGNTLRSYRDLPLRLSELGLVHRYERSGVVHGLFRVKAFTIDDAHIFCREDQIEAEVTQVIRLILRSYKTFGFEEVSLALSTRPKDSMGSDELWERATAGLKRALEENKIEFEIHPGGGAFYGPKIDFEITDSLGRQWQCGTIQLDFQMPERFQLTYVDRDGKEKRPVMVHRAVFGSVERFLGILIEHYGGAFPLWLAPVQVRVASISEKHSEGAQKIFQKLSAEGFRVELDIRPEKIGYKIREAEVEKIPYTCVVGDREVQSERVSVRARGRKEIGDQSLPDFVKMLRQDIPGSR
ncbi:MAG: threonine--tRNA ligase [Candidatus Omnitrophica bacterium]|nr:threonine--tRNA ligase [Candidatus Omnitrophota bacterium]